MHELVCYLIVLCVYRVVSCQHDICSTQLLCTSAYRFNTVQMHARLHLICSHHLKHAVIDLCLPGIAVLGEGKVMAVSLVQ